MHMGGKGTISLLEKTAYSTCKVFLQVPKISSVSEKQLFDNLKKVKMTPPPIGVGGKIILHISILAVLGWTAFPEVEIPTSAVWSFYIYHLHYFLNR